MRVLRNGPAIWALAAAVLAVPAAASAQVETILSCQLSVENGEPVHPPTTLFLRVSPGTYEDFRDGAWGRNFCGAHGGGDAPDAECFVNRGAFRVDWVWKTYIAKLERHVLLDLRTGELTDSDQNGLERKGVCKPAPDPSVQTPAKAPAQTPGKPPAKAPEHS